MLNAHSIAFTRLFAGLALIGGSALAEDAEKKAEATADHPFGKLEFNAQVMMLPFRIGKGSTPLDLAYVEYNPELVVEQAK